MVVFAVSTADPGLGQSRDDFSVRAIHAGARRTSAAPDGEPVPLTPKAVDVLVALVERPGRLVSREELLQEVWRDTFVEEANLSYNIFTLRKALGDTADSPTYIETIPKRGYRFKAPVSLSPGITGRHRPTPNRRMPVRLAPGPFWFSPNRRRGSSTARPFSKRRHRLSLPSPVRWLPSLPAASPCSAGIASWCSWQPLSSRSHTRSGDGGGLRGRMSRRRRFR